MLRARPLFLLVVSLAFLAVVPHAAADESTAFQVNAGHNGFQSGGSLERPPLRERWSRTVGTTTSYPLIARGRVFVVGTVGWEDYYDDIPTEATLYALDADDGTRLWSRAVDYAGPLAYGAGRVFLSDEDGEVTAFDPATGATAWTRHLPEADSDTRLVAAGDAVYVSASSLGEGGNIYALDASDGTTRWATPFWAGGNPTVAGDFVYASDDHEGETIGLRRSDGRKVWERTKRCSFTNGFQVTDGARIMAALGFGYGCGAMLDPRDGAELDTFDTSDWPAMAGDVSLTWEGETMQARSMSSGALLWNFEADYSSPPLVVNETVYVHTGADGILVALDLRTGAELWRGPYGTGAMAAAEGLLVTPARGTVIALESVNATRPGLDLRITSGPEGPTRDTTPTFAFASTTAAPTMCRVDGGGWSSCTASASYSSLADGPHVFEVQSRAADGDVIALATRGFSIDSNVPTATFTFTPKLVTNLRGVGFGLDVDDEWAWVECRLDGSAWTECDTTNPWTELRLADGVHQLEARAQDAVGNVQAVPVSWTWRVDTKRPQTTFQSGPQGATLDTSPTFEFDAGEPATFICVWDGRPEGPCSSPLHVGNLGPGTHTLVVQATDEAGNTDLEPVLRRWNVGGDAVAPETMFVATPPAVTAETGARFEYASNESGTFECRLDDEPWHTCYASRELSSLEDGLHTFGARAIDDGGNVDPTPETWTWRVDTGPPNSTITYIGVSGTSVEFWLAADQASTFECRMDSGAWTPCATGVTYHGLSAGAHVFSARATDAGGNLEVDPATRAFTIASPEPPPPAAGSGAPATNSGQAAPATPQMTTPALARLLARSAAATLKRTSRRALRRGAAIRVHAGGPGVVTLKITTRMRGASITVARVRISFKDGRVRRVRLKPTSAGRRALSKRGKLALKVRVTVAPAGAQPASAGASARV